MDKKQAELAMQKPRKARAIGADEAYFYVTNKNIQVCIRKYPEGSLSAILTRRQLEQALKIMEAGT